MNTKEELEEDEEVKEEGEDMGVARDVDLQAEQLAILDSLRSESNAETRHRRWQEMEAQHTAEEEEMFAYMDEVEQEEEEEEPEPSPMRPSMSPCHGRGPTLLCHSHVLGSLELYYHNTQLYRW